jgi:cold shock CspA family protein
MAKSQETFNKNENRKKKEQKRKEKEQRKEERKANAKEGKSWEDMMAYVDENGNITSTPPDPMKKSVIKEEDIVIGSRNTGGHSDPSTTLRRGKVSFFNTSKGFGFIVDEQSKQSVFVHMNALTTPIKENDIVTFETQSTPKGLSAVNVKRV